jgi:soluble lytic murein transglycosylase-like protein
MLLKKQAVAESGVEPDAVSPVGAKGLPQFMDNTFRECETNEFGPTIPPNRHVSVFDPEDAIRAQADVMGWLLGVWKGDMRKALSSYNFGLGNVRKTLEKHGDKWEEFLPLETKTYLKRVLSDG